MTVGIYEQQDFTGGLNLRADQFQLAENESPKMLNVDVDPRGGVFSRGGYTAINSTVVPSWNPHRLFRFDGDAPQIMLSNSTKVYRSTGANFSVLQYSSGNDIAIGSSWGAGFAQWNKVLYISTGTSGNGGYKWETANTYASALTASGPTWQPYISPTGGYMPCAKLLAVHANKMFAANTIEDGTSYPNRVRWSHDSLPEDWMTDDYLDVEGGGNGITGLAVVSGQLVIFKPRAIFVLFGYDSASFTIVELSNHLGINTPRNAAQSDVGLYFFSYPEGFHYYNGSSIKNIFNQLQPIIDLNYLDVTTKPVDVSWVNNRVWFAVPYSTTGVAATKATVNFVYDPSISDAGTYTMFQSSDSYGLIGGINWENSNGKAFGLLCHANIGRVVSVDNFDEQQDNLDGTASSFVTYYRTKWFDAGSYIQKKMFRRPDFVLKEPDASTVITVDVYHNFDEADGNQRRTFNLTLTPDATAMAWGSGVWGTGLWGAGAASAVVVTGSNLGLARCVQLQFSGELGKKWGINSIGYKFQSRRVKG